MEGTLGEIRIFAGTFSPLYWAFCTGQTVNIQQYTALYAILGTYYGGDGRTTFKLPNLVGKRAVCVGQSPGTSLYDLGEMGTNTTVPMTLSNMPMHTHSIVPTGTLGVSMPAFNDSGNVDNPDGAFFGIPNTYTPYLAPASQNGYMGPATVSFTNDTAIQPAGNANPTPVDVRPAYMALNYIICVEGLFPYRD